MNVPTFEEYISDKENEWNLLREKDDMQGMVRVEKEILEMYEAEERMNNEHKNKQKGNE